MRRSRQVEQTSGGGSEMVSCPSISRNVPRLSHKKTKFVLGHPDREVTGDHGRLREVTGGYGGGKRRKVEERQAKGRRKDKKMTEMSSVKVWSVECKVCSEECKV